MLGEEVEVAVGVEDRHTSSEGNRGDEAVGERPHRHATTAAPSVERRGLLVVVEPLDGHEPAAAEHAPQRLDVVIVTAAGEHFHDHDLRRQQQGVVIDQLPQRQVSGAPGRP